MTLDYKIIRIVNRLENDKVKPVSVNLEAIEDSDDSIISNPLYPQAKSDFEAHITRQRELYVVNKHYSNSKKSKPLLLKIEDLPILESLIFHWNEISPKFIGTYHSGHSWSGYLGTFYYFPDGKEEYHKKDSIPKGYERIKGNSLDNLFPSDGCDYILGHPHTQHYHVGRFDIRLEKHKFGIEDDVSCQIFEGNHPKYILELLKFMKKNPKGALEKLIKNGIKS